MNNCGYSAVAGCPHQPAPYKALGSLRKRGLRDCKSWRVGEKSCESLLTARQLMAVVHSSSQQLRLPS